MANTMQMAGLAVAAIILGLTGGPAAALIQADEQDGRSDTRTPVQIVESLACTLEDRTQCVGETQIVEEVEEWNDFLERKRPFPGLLKFYRDIQTGELFLELTEDEFGEEYIYFSYVHDGSRRDGMRMAGLMGENAVVSFRRRFRHVDVIRRNTDYVMDPDSTLTRAEGTNVPFTVLASLEVVSESRRSNRVIVRANDLFMTNSLVRIGQASAMGRALGVRPGTLNARKTNIRSIRNYEDNTEIVTEFVFDWSGASTPESSSDTTVVQHTFVRMPDDGFTPRRADPRVGFFTERRTNLTRVDGSPVDDLIQRWRLEQTDPDAEVSDVVQPITFWIENTTPLEYRDVIRDAVLAWNPVFEAAGFRNAIRVEVQPDDAVWDAGDVRYNVIRWIASPHPIFGGYGPRFTNPLTGEILGADIVIEHAAVQRWVQTADLFPPVGDGTAAADPEATLDSEALAAVSAADIDEACEAGMHMARSTAFARLAAVAAARAGHRPDIDPDAIIEQGLSWMVAHEVGHTLGLTHNMMASYFGDLETLASGDPHAERRLSASVMDYPGVNLAAAGESQGPFFPGLPGPYDSWAIRFGYAPEIGETEARNALLALSSLPEHVFGNDADAVRVPGRGIDPRVNTYSLSNDPIGFAARQVDVARTTMAGLVETVPQDGESWAETRAAFGVLMGMWKQAGGIVSRYVGGVYVDRSVVGQPGAAEAPFVPVSAAEQRRALRTLGETVFGPDAFDFPPELIARLQPERRGFDALRRAEEPRVQAYVRDAQNSVLAHLLHPRVLNRLTDSLAYGGDYSTHAMLRDLTREIFKGDPWGRPNVYRRNLQIQYIDRLIAVEEASSLQHVPAVAVRDTLRRIAGMNHSWDVWLDAETRAHRRYIRERIAAALDA
jgi:hypothetical protein